MPPGTVRTPTYATYAPHAPHAPRPNGVRGVRGVGVPDRTGPVLPL
ncbi:hypothetical protein [Streptomyces sp. NPDC048606]